MKVGLIASPGARTHESQNMSSSVRIMVAQIATEPELVLLQDAVYTGRMCIIGESAIGLIVVH